MIIGIIWLPPAPKSYYVHVNAHRKWMCLSQLGMRSRVCYALHRNEIIQMRASMMDPEPAIIGLYFTRCAKQSDKPERIHRFSMCSKITTDWWKFSAYKNTDSEVERVLKDYTKVIILLHEYFLLLLLEMLLFTSSLQPSSFFSRGRQRSNIN